FITLYMVIQPNLSLLTLFVTLYVGIQPNLSLLTLFVTLYVGVQANLSLLKVIYNTVHGNSAQFVTVIGYYYCFMNLFVRNNRSKELRITMYIVFQPNLSLIT